MKNSNTNERNIMAYRQWVNPFVLNYETIQDWLYEAEFTRRRQKDYLLST